MKRKVSDTIPVLYLITVLLILFGQFLGTFLWLIPLPASSNAGVTAMMYFEFIGIWIVALLYMRFTKKNRPILKVIGASAAGNNWKNVLLGVGIGFGLNGVCILAAWLNKDISLFFDSFDPVSFLIIFIAVFVQSSAEEVLCRGFLYQRILQSYKNPVYAIVGNAVLFALLHLLNEGVTILSLLNIFVVGILFSLMVYYMDSLWCAMAVHAAWNFTQNIIFGLPNSGIIVPYSVFKLDASVARNSFAYNVGFGIEGTLFADIVLILACICLYLWGRKYGKKNFDLQEEGMVISNMTAVFESDIRKVWETVTSLENYAWRSDLSKIEVQNGTQFIEYTKGGYATSFTVTYVEPYKRWEFDMENDNMKGHWTGIFTQKDDQTEIEFTEEVTAKKFFVKPFMKNYLKKQQSLYVRDLKKALAK